jgi:mono/diheme cytochrome c family protein
MRKASASIPGSLCVLSAIGTALIALSGCAVKHPTANVVHGKQLFVQKCGACHTLSHAGTKGAVGPNLDYAFAQDRRDGLRTSDIRGLVDYWIQYPNIQGVMPAKLFTGQAAADVAGYVSQVVARPGQDTGELASAVPSVSQKPAVEAAGVLEIDADPTGQLKFVASSASGTAGKITLRMKNPSSVPHDIGVQGAGVSQVGPVVSSGGVSAVTATLKAGSYTFYCSVDSHAAAGMKGTLTIK